LVKSLGIAMILALFGFGFGHLYLGYIRRGLFILIAALIVGVNIAFSPSNALFGVIILAAIGVWSIADVYQLGKKLEILTVKNEIACGNCGFKNELDSEYCIKCGIRIQDSCRKCQQLINPQMAYCGKCGATVTV
jgi:hypothetical protein